ncbi:helix-turn-helix domain-containing protein [Fluviispira vulneris]|uniref:helix-turn-helix domain-containing protein n=1 Tax=Fluviispira vulneris TaxID=2763012 RepID=UPI00164728D5|nr:helix-turn-helix transcriptional regulator [Fluviispira vulneris]
MLEKKNENELDRLESTVRKRFATLLRRERTRMNLTQTEFSKLMGFKGFNLLAKYENSDIVNIPLSTYYKFAEITGLNFKYVICDIFLSDVNENQYIPQKFIDFIFADFMTYYKAPDSEDVGKLLDMKNAFRIALMWARLPDFRKLCVEEVILKELYIEEDDVNEQKFLRKKTMSIFDVMSGRVSKKKVDVKVTEIEESN